MATRSTQCEARHRCLAGFPRGKTDPRTGQIDYGRPDIESRLTRRCAQPVATRMSRFGSLEAGRAQVDAKLHPPQAMKPRKAHPIRGKSAPVRKYSCFRVGPPVLVPRLPGLEVVV